MRAPSVPFRFHFPTRVASGASVVIACLTAALAAGCAAPLPRDIHGSPPTARLVPNAVPPAPVTQEEKQRIGALNQQVLQEQDAAIARYEQAQAYARASRYVYPSMSLYYGGWGGGGWGGGIGFSSPGYWGWGGYPYWW